MDQLTDEQLIKQIQMGKNEAYRLLVERHKNYIFTLIFQMIGHRETAEDLSQEVFIKLFRTLSSFQGNSKFKTWLYRLTVNLVIDHRRSQKRKSVVAWVDEIKDKLFTDSNEEPETRTIIKEKQEMVYQLINELPDKYRIIIYLYHLKEFSCSEIAEIMQLPLKTVETRLYRGKKRLRQKWMEVDSHVQENSKVQSTTI
ncbi:RNA polymerase sigma factor [Chengkuizengella marina]|uniref:Sigma-70 family RNA polymerase sigma factor n=1 Tax=Chengkuizengella marina TaxID=2507566 RepID=A0A6N9Q536_9BACL|nr:sigma-70 family RNA polymerase sigma factor [Chengkuizengella marina]NBI29969.1 sigma-70 family RNA polymerase sigma factor [Chengkuizengella marina]